jgi:uncharacterized phage-associated protein
MNAMDNSSGLDGRAVANFVLDFCAARGRPITQLPLQKIVYFCHVWSLIGMGRPLVRHQFEAWKYGPVLQYLYREFQAYDDLAIVGRATRLNPTSGEREIVPYRFDGDTKEFLEQVVDFYSRISPGDLVRLSHAKGGPWDKAWNHDGPVNPGMKISDADIVTFYSKARLPFTVQ